jgi:hypothetical protein
VQVEQRDKYRENWVLARFLFGAIRAGPNRRKSRLYAVNWRHVQIIQQIGPVLTGLIESIFRRPMVAYAAGNQACAASSEAAAFDFLGELFDELVERLGAEVVLVAVADGDRAFFRFALADDEHVGDAGEAGEADFGADFV